MEYELKVGKLTRYLPIMNISDELAIGSFVMLGDSELVEESAALLAEKLPEFDYIVTAEAKGIPLAHEMARQHGDSDYFIARKHTKLYMTSVFESSVRSITTDADQHLYLDGKDAEKMRGKRILLVDDVISTGESLRALEALVEKAGGIICGKMAILAEGDAQERPDLIYLEKLPVFNADGTVKA